MLDDILTDRNKHGRKQQLLERMLTSCGILVCHCVVQLRDSDPVWWILESSHIKYQHEISAWMVATNRWEMARTCLTQTSSKIRNNYHIGACARLGSNQISKFLLRCFCAYSERPNIQRIADCKAGKLIKCYTWLLNYLNTESTVQSSTARHCKYDYAMKCSLTRFVVNKNHMFICSISTAW